MRKTQRPATPKENKLDSTIGKKSIASQRQNNKKEEVSESKTPAEPVRKSSSPSASDLSPNNNKRRSLTPVTNGPAATKKKKVSEIDRLMGDEGAVNMINSLEKLGTVETKSARPMMRSRAATICERVSSQIFKICFLIFTRYYIVTPQGINIAGQNTTTYND